MRTITLFAIAILLSFTACKKRRDNRSTVSSQDNAAAEAGFNDIQKVTEAAMKDNDLEKAGSALNAIYGNCATVTVNPPLPDMTFPKTVTIDFGSTNCTDSYGVNRRGVITATITGKYRDVGAKFTIVPQDYYLNDNKIEGTKVVTNLGPNSAGNSEFSVVISNGKITYDNGDVTTYESSRIREWVLGEDTDGILEFFDDEYDITGTASGVDRNGRDYDIKITSPLRVAVVCRWIKQGTVELQPDGLHLRTLDFGTGGCDANATVEINGNTYNIVMP